MKRIFTQTRKKISCLSLVFFAASFSFGQNQMTLPVTFEDPTQNYGLIGFGGADSSYIVVDPTNGANTVARVYKSSSAQLWAGTTVTDSANSGFATAIPFAVGATSMTVKVWSPDANIQVRLKAEDSTDPTISVETEATVSTANAWETLTFNFANQAAGTAAINLANSYNKVSIFFNFGVDGATAGAKTYYFDDVMFAGGGGPALAQMDLPVTFEDANTNYSLIGFGGAEVSSIVVDPTNSSNTVAEVIKSAAAQTWAGTTITDSTNSGLANPIPFASGATEMKLKVWSPDANIPVRLKVEDYTNPGISVETEAMTTMAGQWETLVFDFANQAAGTAAIDFNNSYNKASVFFNFGTDGATAGQKTYYFDDLDMNSAQTGLSITVDVCSTTADTVRMTGPFWGWDPNGGPLATDNGNGTWTVNLNPAPTANMEYLFIVDGVQENLIQDMQNGGTCAPVTDYFSYANRIWNVGDTSAVDVVYDRCVSCAFPDLVITTEICDSTITPTEVRLAGPIWGNWNPTTGPLATDNGDGTWTVTISPAPMDSFQYLMVIDGTTENLIQAMIDSGDCAPVTDYSTYANRLWTLGQPGTIDVTYGQCITCATASLVEADNTPVSVYPNPTSSTISISRENNIEQLALYNVMGEKVLDIEVNAQSTDIDLSEMASGIYHLVVSGANSVSHAKIIKD